ncbi:MAG: substrate-binding domain-containing protein [Amylibacter sp.]|nr:substrate-binding domain-containing protein [Amylibacter sp.]
MIAIVFAGWATLAMAQAAEIKVAVTTSFYNSGLSEILLPQIKADIGLDVQLIVVGTGQALRLGQAGDVDAILVHSRKAEDAFLEAGYGTHRREIMYNDFVIIGPSDDPAKINGSSTAAQALTKIQTAAVPFASRGDDSGTHKKELALWASAGVSTDDLNAPWYNAAGAGMGATLNVASGMNAYVLSDRASWLNFGNKADLVLLYAGDPVLFNQYAYIPVNPDMHSYIKNDLAMALENWLVGPTSANLISNYKINGETLFTFNAVAN